MAHEQRASAGSCFVRDGKHALPQPQLRQLARRPVPRKRKVDAPSSAAPPAAPVLVPVSVGVSTRQHLLALVDAVAAGGAEGDAELIASLSGSELHQVQQCCLGLLQAVQRTMARNRRRLERTQSAAACGSG